ncbi:U-box domain-containing protein 3 [Salvia miltiorrhiza]|uniref:U-box domain-containing protein 3 n=1 Tax=Salvia miltiorrhiza TaxID=226208 RepID=UPI0025AC3DAA|nr:U-box domain-containing protein 3 [Salvia miltiorrhiza]XP_057798106.1 U-box domain-containing protein 3 [Salvia miltiorrhiza]
MDLTPLRCLINSISRFIHLVTCRVSSTMPAEKDYQTLVSMLKHLKPVLDDVSDHKAPLDEALFKECEELDIAVNEAREFLEKWSPRTSKLLFVLQSKPLLLSIQIASVKLSCILCKIFESLPTSSSLAHVQFSVQECQNLKLGQLAEQIEEILKSQKEGKVPGVQHLKHIIESFNLTSGEEILNEYIALEKEKQKAEGSDIKGDLDHISRTVDLLSHVRDYVVNLEKFKAINDIQIPSYFRCPLSLELMLDPVIVASGQTYERAAIQKWLDYGLGICPKTGNKLSHKNLIPNYTVKALITNWSNENKLELISKRENLEIERVHSPLEHISHEDDSQCPQSGNSASGSSFRHGLETQKVGEERYRVSRGVIEKLDQSSPEHSYVHSRSESESSAVSSIDYVATAETENARISNKQENVIDKSDDTESACSTSHGRKSGGASHSLHGRQCISAKTMGEMVVNGNHNPSRAVSLPSESGYDVLTSTSHVEELVNSLKSASNELQTAAARELRFLGKSNMENRIIIGECGAIAPLIALLHSDVEATQEHAVTALLNLSINENIKARIAEEGALEPLIHVLRTGNAGAKENAAATLFSISLIDEYRIKIGRSGAIKPLVDLLGRGTIRGKKDAATALFNLSIFHENKARIVQAGAVKHLVMLLDPESEMIDKAVALLANLSTIAEGCSAIAREEGIPLLVEIVDMGSQRGKENAASVLLQLCINSPKYCRSILQEGAVPPLVALSQSGTPRAKEKAQQLLSHFRNQRESSAARGRS